MDSAEVILPPCMLPNVANAQSSESDSRPSSKSTCPWGKVSNVETVCFNDVMSEQLASVLCREEEVTSKIKNQRPLEPHQNASKTPGDAKACDDFMLAQMLQLEFDKEHDNKIRQGRKKFDARRNEKLASVLQREEVSAANEIQRHSEPCLDSLKTSTDVDTSDDFVLAQMLQLEFDKEHDGVLRQEERKFNGTSKVSVSFDKYLRLPSSSISDDDDDEEKELMLELKANGHWSNFEEAEKALQAVGKSGVSRQGNTTTTKHDIVMCGRRNASRLLKFPPCIETGDSYDMKLSNSVFNTLKVHSRAEDRRCHKIHDKKEKATAEKALDEKTCLILYKFVNNGVFEAVNGCISTGKEAVVYHANSGQSEKSPHQEYALKVFKTSLNEFQNRDQYITDDYRFRDRLNRQNPRKVILWWAEKEMRNLIRIKKANIPCPDVVALKKHVLVMSFIGNNMIPAPKLKEVDAPFEDLTIMYEQTLDIMSTLYEECQLVHADLSEYNLLWHDGKVWVIDVSQAVETTHPRSLEFLLRDCRNICGFFEKQGVIDVLKPEALFTKISGCTSVSQKEDKTSKKTVKNTWIAESV